MNKKFEYVDDNPGAYFSMLVEGLEDKEDKKELKENKPTKSKKLAEDLHTEKQIKLLQSRLSDFRKSWINLRDTLEYVDYEVASSIDDNYPFDMSFDELSFDVIDWLEDCIARCDWLYDEAQKNESLKEQKEVTRDEKIKAISSNPEARKMAQKLTDQGELSLDAIISFVYADFFGKEESLKEDKFVSRDKMSKKGRKELDSQKRNTWGNTNPVTKVQPNKKAYDRKRDSKVIEEAKQLNEVRDFEWGQELWAVVKDNGNFAGNPCLSWEEAREISANHEGSKIYEMALDRDQINESVSKKDLYDALKDAYGMTKKEADKWIKDASEKSKEEIVKGFKGNAKKSFKYD